MTATLILDDIDPNFIKLAKRLQQIANLTGNGMQAITLTVFLCEGHPIQWTRPEVNNLNMLEPKGYSDDFIDALKGMRK